MLRAVLLLAVFSLSHLAQAESQGVHQARNNEELVSSIKTRVHLAVTPDACGIAEKPISELGPNERALNSALKEHLLINRFFNPRYSGFPQYSCGYTYLKSLGFVPRSVEEADLVKIEVELTTYKSPQNKIRVASSIAVEATKDNSRVPEFRIRVGEMSLDTSFTYVIAQNGKLVPYTVDGLRPENSFERDGTTNLYLISSSLEEFLDQVSTLGYDLSKVNKL